MDLAVGYNYRPHLKWWGQWLAVGGDIVKPDNIRLYYVVVCSSAPVMMWRHLLTETCYNCRGLKKDKILQISTEYVKKMGYTVCCFVSMFLSYPLLSLSCSHLVATLQLCV